MLIRGCHAPVLVRQGTAEARHRAPTYRDRWVEKRRQRHFGMFANRIRSPGNRAAFFVGSAHTRQGQCPCTHLCFAAVLSDLITI